MLVVEMDRQLSDVLRFVLSHAGYEVVPASARALARWRQHVPDVVLLERVHLQGDGLAVRSEIRRVYPRP
jgi:DNA-binding response OmpR family regulator